MSDIIRVCPKHGDLTINDIRIKDKRRIAKDGHKIISRMCKHCDNDNAKKWKAKSGYKPKYREGRHRQRIYGISPLEYKDYFDQQKGLCAICLKAETRILRNRLCSLGVDHDHQTGKIRQLLCHKCNAILGLANDSIEILLEAISYLRRHKTAG